MGNKQRFMTLNEGCKNNNNNNNNNEIIQKGTVFGNKIIISNAVSTANHHIPAS